MAAVATQVKGRVGRPLEVKVALSVNDVAAILDAVIKGETVSLNGERAKTRDGKAIRLTFISQEG